MSSFISRRTFLEIWPLSFFYAAHPTRLESAQSSALNDTIRKTEFRVAYILFDGITTLDFIGFYDPISQLKAKKFLPKLSWDTCALQPTIKDSFGLTITVDLVEPDLASYDLIFVPGGFGTRPLQREEKFLAWLQTSQTVPYKVSVCTGSLLLGAAGFLKGKKATTNFNEYETLKPYCQLVVKDRIVQDGNTITGGAVATSLDLGLYVCEMLAGKEAKESIQKRMAYQSCL